MSDRRTKSEIIAELAKDYAERIRRGERPTAREYSARYPEFSDEVDRFIASKRVDEAPPSADGASPTGTPQTHRTAENVQPERIGDFRIIRQVGRGGMGIVYEAEQMSLGRHVALKLLPPQMLLDARQRRRFQREARSAAKLHHTNIVPVFGVGESDGLHYYAMQFIEGLGLDEVLKQVRQKRGQSSVSSGITLAPLHVSRRNFTGSEMARSSQSSSRGPCPGESSDGDADSNRDDDATLVTPLGKTGGHESVSAGSASAGRLSDSFSLSDSIVDLPTESGSDSVPVNRAQNYWHSIADVGLQVSSALQYAHEQGVFHRDIKPSNLLLDTRGTIWVLDFGLAKASDQHDLTHTGDVVGTLRYMPPEAFEGRADARSDIYSLGLTLYEMLAMRPAFNEAERNKLIKQVTSGEPTRLARLDRKIPRDLVTIVHKAIDRDPKRRYQTAEELADDLNRFRTDKPIRARRTSTIEHVYRWARRNRALSTSMGVIAILLITINIAGPILTVRLKQAYDAEVRASRRAKYAYESEAAAHSRASQAEREAVVALALAKQKEQEALQSLQLAEEREHALNRTLYRAEMSLAGQAAVERTGIERVWDMTAAWRPGPGDEDLRDWEWYYLHGLGRLDRRTIPIDSGNAEAVAWHPSGSLIALGRDDGTVEVLDLRLGRAVFSQNRHHAPVLHVCWNSDGTLLASIASQDDHVRIWEPATERELQTLPLSGTNNWSGSVSFNWNDRLLAADGLDEIAIWDLQTGKRLRTLKMPQGIGHVAWSPTDDRIAATSKQEQITIWNGMTGEQLRSLPDGSRCLAWDPQGQRLAFGGQDRRIHVLDVETGEKSSSSVGHVAEITTLAWDASGMRLASSGRDTTVRIWELPNCDEIARFRGHAGTVTSLDWNPLGTLLVTAAQDQTIKIWDADQTEEQITLHGSAGPVQSTSWGPQGNRLVVSSGAWTRLWNIDRRAQESAWQGQLAVINPIDQRIAIATQSDIQIRDTRTGKLVKRLLGHTQGVTAIRWDSEGKRLASASWDGTARVWDVATGKTQTTLRLSHNDRDICWSPDGACLATIGNREVQIWHVESEAIRLEYLDDHQIHAIAWSPDGQSIASGGWGHEITIWDASTAETVMVMTGHTSPVKSLCWSPEGTRLASGSEDQLVRIWDVQSRGELLSLRGHTDGVTSVCWSSDGMRIASGDRQGRVLIWDASSGHLRERTPQSLDILNRRIDSEPSLRDLALRTEVLEKMGRGEAASEDRRRIRLIREADFEELASDPVALELLVTELSAEVRTREAARWTLVKPFEMTADSGAMLSLQPDNSIYVTGPNTAGVRYEFSFIVNAPITALRLEAIPDPRLPYGGSGRSTKNGNFHVAEINVLAAQSADSEMFDEVAIEQCSDDMRDFPDDRRAIQTIDGNRGTRWDPYPNHKQHHWAVYEFAEPLTVAGQGVVILVQLDSGISQWGPHGLGRFRISFTETADAVEREELLQYLDGMRPIGIAQMGGIYAMLSETQRAGEAFATALRSAEDHAERQAIVALASRFDGVVEELFKLLPEDPWVMLTLADSMIAGPDATHAAGIRSRAIKSLVEEAGNAPETILRALSEAAESYQARGQWDRALRLLRQAHEQSRDLLSPENPRTIELLGKLAATYDGMGNHDQARKLREEEVAWRQRVQGMEDAQTLASCHVLAEMYVRSWQISEAISLRVRMAGAAPEEDINASQQAAFFLAWEGDLEEHAALCRKLLASAEETGTLKAARDFAKAVTIRPVHHTDLAKRAVALAAQAVDAAPSNMWGVLSLGMSHYRQGDLMQAEQWLTRAADAEPPRLRLLARAFLAMIRFQQEEPEEATNHLHAVEEGLGLVAFTDLRSPFAIHHDDLAIWLALQEVRQMMQVEPADFQQAVDQLLECQRKVVERSPDDTLKSLHLAALYAWFGRDRQHRELCQQLLAAASVAKQTVDLERAAKAYLVRANPEPDLLASAAVSAEMAVDGLKKNPGLLPWAQLTTGMAAYRQQRYTEAIESLTRAQQASNRLIQGPSLLFRSMAFLRQGQRERAEQDFARADQLIGPLPDRTSLTEELSRHDELVFFLAYNEARQQLATTTGEHSSKTE